MNNPQQEWLENTFLELAADLAHIQDTFFDHEFDVPLTCIIHFFQVCNKAKMGADVIFNNKEQEMQEVQREHQPQEPI